MRRPPARLLLIAGAVIVVIAAIVMRSDSGPYIATVDASRGPDPAAPETVGLCPWRTPDADRLHFFPDSTGFQDETLLLSRHRAEIARALGRPPAGLDNILPLHWIDRGDARLGTIITRCVRGESGVIELVLAVDQHGKVVGAKLQRLREPDDVARVLQAPGWLGAMRGKTTGPAWQSGKDFPDVPPAARVSANAILDGARTILVLLEVGRPYGSKSSAELTAEQHNQELNERHAP